MGDLVVYKFVLGVVLLLLLLLDLLVLWMVWVFEYMLWVMFYVEDECWLCGCFLN